MKESLPMSRKARPNTGAQAAEVRDFRRLFFLTVENSEDILVRFHLVTIKMLC